MNIGSRRVGKIVWTEQMDDQLRSAAASGAMGKNIHVRGRPSLTACTLRMQQIGCYGEWKRTKVKNVDIASQKTA